MDQIELMGLGTEMRNPDTMNLDEMSPMEIISAMNREDAGVVAAVAETLPQVAQIVVFATQSLRLGGRIIYIGAGTSGRLGVLDAVECPPTFGVTDQEVIGLIAGGEGAFVRAKEGAEDDEAQGGRDLDAIGLTSRDTVIYTAVFSAENASHGETHLDPEPTATPEGGEPQQTQPPEPAQDSGGSVAGKIVVTALAGIAALAIIGYGGWRGYKFIRDKKRGYV